MSSDCYYLQVTLVEYKVASSLINWKLKDNKIIKIKNEKLSKIFQRNIRTLSLNLGGIESKRKIKVA